ncbi:MAG: RNA 2',3'-cyclic phosphodiesterase [Nitrosopumilaceae archaeon]|uniref:RNA 2',3'-cyclic phosphodiesterase n=1 Tax=Candidatus Nitrosomaritimum aestuariumsis TaxID=3342354 RepID=A0AC60W3T0_9ARCH|nr:RNA 2',3'-cyclic phosphodiesterase [Nitrosopumilaceae archaeon]
MRTFVAVEISNGNVIDSIRDFQSKISFQAKPVALQNLHFTLQFLGEISEENCEKIKQNLKTIEFQSFKINFKGVGAFPNMRSPRVVWIGVDDVGAKKLEKLANEVKNALKPLEFSPDKPFKSHITIFRIKNKIGNITKDLENFKTCDFGNQIVSNFKLKQSVLTPKGPVYSDLEEIIAK